MAMETALASPEPIEVGPGDLPRLRDPRACHVAEALISFASLFAAR